MDAIRLAMKACRQCGQVDSLTRAVCSRCFATGFEPATIEGSGRLVSWTTIRRAPTRFRDDAPYDVCVVDLVSGHRVTGRLAGRADGVNGATWATGMSVAAREIRNDTPIFVTAPAGKSDLP